jgi:hypothetical protein
MLRISFLFVIGAFLAAETNAQVDSALRFDGFGPVRVGMTLVEVNKVLHTSYTRPTDPDERACRYVEVPNRPGIGLMILNGRVARVDVDDATTHTAEGLHKGDSEAHALRVYGKRLKVTPSVYSGREGNFLTVHSTNGKYGLRFETYGGQIFRYYAGTAEAIEYIEGCQ